MIFKGVATALVTPFTEDDRVDVSALERIVEYQLEGNVDALVALGTTGEPATLNRKEKELVLKTVAKKAKGKIPVIVGAGSNDTKSAIDNCAFAKDNGADALLLVTPYYNKCTQEGLVRHFGTIADATSLPILLYNVPSRTGVNMLPETLEKLLSKKNIVGVKEASGNMEQIEKCIAVAQDKAVVSGDDALTVATVALGGQGVISVASNVCPSYVSKMTHCALQGDFDKAREMQLRLLPFISALFCEVNPIPAKYAMNALGFCSAAMRLPLTEMTNSNAARLKSMLSDFV